MRVTIKGMTGGEYLEVGELFLDDGKVVVAINPDFPNERDAREILTRVYQVPIERGDQLVDALDGPEEFLRLLHTKYTGSYLRAYPAVDEAEKAFCPTGEGGGVDPTCSPSDSEGRAEGEEGFVPKAPSTSFVKDKIAQAIRSVPNRMVHGNTKYNSFFVMDDGRIFAHNEWNKIPESDRKNMTSVHSHSSDSRKNDPDREPLEDFQPLNAADVKIFLDSVKRGWATHDAIIMADGRMEMLSITPDTDPAVFKLGQAKLDHMLHRGRGKEGYDARAKYYEEHKDDPDFETYALERVLMREFANKYGLKYQEGLRWKKKKGE